MLCCKIIASLGIQIRLHVIDNSTRNYKNETRGGGG